MHEDGKGISQTFSAKVILLYPALIEDKIMTTALWLLEEAEIMQIPKEDFTQMIYGDISIAAKFIRIITQNVKGKRRAAYEPCL